ncbi:MAG: acyl-[ACP]--phospholipid O-acyltransferase [Gammaproteobacteria bacterium]|nr:AMP-binding protein [Beggiatoa alba]PCH60937.1 MAG: acyl-[ACP]--phospholipid O-acyltransferase [Gammaproteobacteria bacterium]
MHWLKISLQWLLRLLFRVELKGMEHYEAAGDRVLIVANHVSLLDGLLLAVFLPDKVSFAIDTQWAKKFSLIVKLVNVFPMDGNNPLSIKGLVRNLQKDNKVVIFPEGRITVTGALMKVYPGPGMVAQRSGATILPLRIDGAQYSRFSYLKNKYRLRFFPKITLTICPPKTIKAPEHLSVSKRREYGANALYRIMTDMMFETSQFDTTILQAIISAAKTNGWNRVVIEDLKRAPLTYRSLLMRSFILGKALSDFTDKAENVGVFLPSAAANIVTVLALQAYGRIPAMLNFSVGAKGVISACETAALKNVITSRQFIEAAGLEDVIGELKQHVSIHYLEDQASKIGIADKLRGYWQARRPQAVIKSLCSNVRSIDPAIILFTSGSEGMPKGVVLSHRNIVANAVQIAARIDFGPGDIVLNALPMFHSFGLTGGTFLPLLSGMKTFLYPSPLHYKVIPDVAYHTKATVMFGTNTFLAGYAKYAHPYDFYNLRYVIAGAEKLRDETRDTWMHKFGVRILEGYGVTETSPVLSVNTPIACREGSVGRLLPGIEYQLEKVEGVAEGGRLHVKGPNIMLGYYLHDNPATLVPPKTRYGDGWHDTGDIVKVEDGFVTILGRAKRFAKIGGELVSLAAVEETAYQLWPDANHAVVSIFDERKGEKLMLLTTQQNAERSVLVSFSRGQGIAEINIPKEIIITKTMPLLGTGKVDFNGVKLLIEKRAAQ